MINLDDEQKSLTAIKTLEDKNLPYAATLLVYVLLERHLKLHLLEIRNSLTNEQVETLPPKVSQSTAARLELKNLDEDSFVLQVLKKCALGTLEEVYGVSCHKYSTHRNDIFHSNLFISQ